MSIILCIPRLSSDVSKEYIMDTIKKMQIGSIETLHEIPLQNNTRYKRIIIRITWDLSKPSTQYIYSILSDNKSIKIVHDMPWYWICVKYVKQGPQYSYSGLYPSLKLLLTD